MTKSVDKRLRTRSKFYKDLYKTKSAIWLSKLLTLTLTLIILNNKRSSKKTLATSWRTLTSDLMKTVMLNLGSTLRNSKDNKKKRKTEKAWKTVSLISLARSLLKLKNCLPQKRKSLKKKPKRRPLKTVLTVKNVECNSKEKLRKLADVKRLEQLEKLKNTSMLKLPSTI